MIIVNNEKHSIHYGEYTLLPGSNVVDDEINLCHPIIKSMIDSGALDIVKKVNAEVAKIAIKQANTQEVVDKIEKSVKKSDASVKKAAANRKKELDDFDAEWEAARKKQEEKKEV